MAANNKYVWLSVGCIAASLIVDWLVAQWAPLRQAIGGTPIIPMVGAVAALIAAWLGRKTLLGKLWLSGLLLWLVGVYVMYASIQPTTRTERWEQSIKEANDVK